MHARWDRLARRAAIGTTFAVLLLGSTGCAGSTTSEAAKPGASASGTTSARPAATQGGERSSCARVRDVFVHLAGVSAGWDPTRDPFDTHTAAAFAPLIKQLRTESGSATSGRLRTSVDRNADALSHLAVAMRAHEQAGVTAALATSRRAYAALPSCARRGGRTAHDQPSTTTTAGAATGSLGGPAPSSQQAGVVHSEARDPGCIRAKAAYHQLAPVTSKWDINADPFDADVAAAFRSTADALDSAADAAQASGVATKAKANAAAFRLLAASMNTKDAAKVDDSVITMQQTAVTLATTCPLS